MASINQNLSLHCEENNICNVCVFFLLFKNLLPFSLAEKNPCEIHQRVYAATFMCNYDSTQKFINISLINESISTLLNFISS